jgi:hypothetical protein
MSITTYAELKSAAADFLNRDDLTSVISTFVTLAEADIQRKLRHWRMEKRSSAEIDTQYSAIPADWVETIRFYVTSGQTSPLSLISQSEMLQRRMETGNVAGRPLYYASTGAQLELFPTPNATYDAELLYYSKLDTLSDSTTSNWLLEEAPDVYLYGTLMHSAPYLKDDQRIAIWAGLYQAGIDTLNSASDSAKYSGSGLKMKIRGLS